jgi:glyoxylase-like metal-dependent hydrolase (beta-lactamase superfamily II)
MMARGVLATLLAAAAAACAHVPTVNRATAMWRLDCGRFQIDNLGGRQDVSMPVSCYLIRSGDQVILFDAGLEASLFGRPQREEGQTLHLDRRLVDQLGAIGIDPAEVTTLIVSHHHGDHHGQADLFPNARLLMGAGDVAVLRSESDKGGHASWLNGDRPIEQISADRDLTGDGRLVVLFTPGHTPGHLSMLVKLARSSYILTGDLVHSRDQLTTRKPSGNHVDKVRGKAEIERVIALAEANKATIVVGHDSADIALLPSFPKAAE